MQEKLESQNSNANWKMNQKEWSLSTNYSQQMKMERLSLLEGFLRSSSLLEGFLKKIVSKFLEYLMKNNHYGEQVSKLRKFVPATLPKWPSLLLNFSEIFHKFSKNSFEYKKGLLGVVSPAYKWHRYVYSGGVASLFLWA